MRFTKAGLVGLAAVVIILGPTATLAFHEGGVGTCTRCHSMHNGLSDKLLFDVDASSTCLDCHEGSAGGYRVSTASASAGAGIPPLQMGPGGDFRWLSKTYSWTLPRSGTNNGRGHGHNIVAAGTNGSAAPYGYVADTTNTTAPGGTMLSSGLKCASCHDPHGSSRRLEDGTVINPGDPAFSGTTYEPTTHSGSYPDPYEPETGYALGVYRLLGGPGYVAFGTTTFPGAPIAVVPEDYNRSESVTETRVAYGYPLSGHSGTTSWGSWCGTCHPDYHVAPGGKFVHPVDESLGSTVSINYNKYVKTGDLTGTDATSFDTLTPFVENTDDYAVLASHAVNDGSLENGPTDSDRVGCLTCHRAHASAWDNAWRWNQSAEFLTVADETTGIAEYAAADNEHSGEGHLHRGYSLAEMTAAYYGRPATVFAGYQRDLCNKCHIKD